MSFSKVRIQKSFSQLVQHVPEISVSVMDPGWRSQGGGPWGEVPGGRSQEEGPRGSRTYLFFLSDTKILTTTRLQITSQYEEFQIHRS